MANGPLRIDQIKRQLRTLAPAQLHDLQAYIKGLLAVGGNAPVLKTHSWVYDAFEAECHGLGLGYITKSVGSLVALREPFLLKYLEHSLPPDCSGDLVMKRAIISAGVVLLYNDLLENGRMVSPRHLAFGLERLPAVIDRAFPGYAAAKLLFMIVNKGVRDAANRGHDAITQRKHPHHSVHG